MHCAQTIVITPVACNAAASDQATGQIGDSDNGNSNGGMRGNWTNGDGDQPAWDHPR